MTEERPAQAPPEGPPPPGYWTPGSAPPQESTNGFAIAALIFSIIGGVLLGIIFGIVALRQIPRRGQRGKGMAVSALIISGMWTIIIAIGVFVVLTTQAQRDPSGEIAEAGDVGALDVTLGDCLNDVEEGLRVLSVSAIPCSEPHDAQVYALIALPDGQWPGLDKVTLEAEQQCADRLASEFSEVYDDESVGLFYLHPTEESWARGDREIVCLAEYLDGPRTGSLLE